jgi:hypothetical protein
MEIAKKNSSSFVRILIVLFCLFLAAMVSYKFVWGQPRAEISAGIITLLCMLLVLVLAESFDNFSLGKLITISREAEKKEREVAKLEGINEKLNSQLVAMSNSLSQKQTLFNVPGGNVYMAPGIVPASEEEVRAREDITEKEKQPGEPEQAAAAVPAPSRIYTSKLNRIGITKLLGERGLDGILTEDAKFATRFQGLDPIGESQVIFDGYLNGKGIETFIEVKVNRFFSAGTFYLDRLYVMLSKINYYRMAKQTDVRLELVLVNLPHEEQRSRSPRMLEYFQPAIVSGLLRITEISLTEAEEASIRQA